MIQLACAVTNMRDLCSILLQLRRTPAAMKGYACPLTRIYAVPCCAPVGCDMFVRNFPIL